jgi:hypothetical protein
MRGWEGARQMKVVLKPASNVAKKEVGKRGIERFSRKRR